MEKVTEKQAVTIMTAAKKITFKALKTIEAKGNTKAAEILNTYQHPILEDLHQAVNERTLEVVSAILWELPNDASDTHKNDLAFLGYTFADYYTDGEKQKSESKRYIFQVVQNELYKLMQREYKREFIPVFTEDENGVVVESTAMVTAALQAYRNSIENDHVKELVEDLRGLLTEKQNTVLTLLIEGYSQKEAAAIMGISQERVKQIKQNIRRKAALLNNME